MLTLEHRMGGMIPELLSRYAHAGQLADALRVGGGGHDEIVPRPVPVERVSPCVASSFVYL